MSQQAISLVVAIAAIGLSTSAQACRQLSSPTKYGLSDAVVDGLASCNKNRAWCTLRVDRVSKGDKTLRGKTVKISVDVRPPIKKDGDKIILRHCPQTFEPWKSETSGRFFLVASKDGTYDAAFPPDVADAELFDFEFEEML